MKKVDPPKLAILGGGVHFLHFCPKTPLSGCIMKNAIPLSWGLSKKNFSLKFGFNLPNFTTLGGCLLKNWTFVQKLVSYCILWWNKLMIKLAILIFFADFCVSMRAASLSCVDPPCHIWAWSLWRLQPGFVVLYFLEKRTIGPRKRILWLVM